MYGIDEIPQSTKKVDANVFAMPWLPAVSNHYGVATWPHETAESPLPGTAWSFLDRKQKPRPPCVSRPTNHEAPPPPHVSLFTMGRRGSDNMSWMEASSTSYAPKLKSSANCPKPTKGIGRFASEIGYFAAEVSDHGTSIRCPVDWSGEQPLFL